MKYLFVFAISAIAISHPTLAKEMQVTDSSDLQEKIVGDTLTTDIPMWNGQESLSDRAEAERLP